MRQIVISRTWHVYAIVVGVISAAYLTVPQLHSGPVFTALSLAPVGAIIYGMRWAEGQYKRVWVTFALGQLAFAIGDLITYNYGGSLPFPSIGDVAYLAVYPFMFTGVVLLLDRYRNNRRRVSRLDDFYTGLGAGLAVFAGILTFTLYSLPHFTPTMLGVLYPALDFVFAAMLFSLRPGDGEGKISIRNNPNFWHTFTILVLGVVSLGVTDTVYAVTNLLEKPYMPGGMLDLGWLLYYLALGTVAITGPDERPFENVFSNSETFGKEHRQHEIETDEQYAESQAARLESEGE